VSFSTRRGERGGTWTKTGRHDEGKILFVNESEPTKQTNGLQHLVYERAKEAWSVRRQVEEKTKTIE